jgi:hypothetical protein
VHATSEAHARAMGAGEGTGSGETSEHSSMQSVVHWQAVPNIAVDPTPNSFRSFLASAIGRGSPQALGFAVLENVLCL